MNRTPFGPKMTCLGMGLVLLTSILIAQDDPDDRPGSGIFDQAALTKDDLPPEQEGVQAQAMGMVHEAFASPSVFTAQASNPVDTEPPQPIEELPPDQKPEGDNVQWINGYFAFEEQKKDFYWVSGIWRNIPPNMEWVPGAWNRTAQGWQYYSGFWKRASEGELAVVPPPPEPLQTVDPPQPSADATYIPGTWVYRETRYVWRPAIWVPYRVGWVWVPARFVYTHCGWVFIDGYWDYARLHERGICYAPVYVSATFYRRPGWIYRPAYVIHDHALLSCLFINRRTGCYVFGDYYGDYYSRSGIYVSWSTYRINRYPDPLFSHYRYTYRNDPRWEVNLVALQRDRYKGIAPRPPVTIVQQTTIVKNNNTHINNLTLLAPATKIDRKVVPIKTLNAVQVQKQADLAKQMRDATKLRAANETKLAKNIGTVKVGDAPKTLALNLPKTTQTTVLTTKVKNLPPPPTGQKSQLPTGVGTADKGVVVKDKAPVKDKVATDKVTLPKDKTPVTDKAPIKDKVTLPKDKLTLPKDKTPMTDKAPIKDKVTLPPKDKLTLPKDKTPTTDKAPIKDKVITDKGTPPKDKVTLPKKDKISLPTDKSVSTDKDKATLSTDKLTLPKDKSAVTDKAVPAKEKATPKEKGKAKDKGAAIPFHAPQVAVATVLRWDTAVVERRSCPLSMQAA